MKDNRKYKINEYLLTLNQPSYRAALKILPKELGIAYNTLHNYRNLQLDDKADIPHAKVMHMEMLFGMQYGELANFPKKQHTLRELIDRERE